jgi:phage terminase small subunit
MSNQSTREPPKHLSRSARAWWRRIAEGWQLDDSSWLLLQVALEAYDRLTQARETIERDGLVVDGRLNPACQAEKDSRIALLRAWRQLSLDVEPPGPVGRPAGR